MAKFFSTQNKKMVAAVSLVITGWHALTMGGNSLNLPSLPTFVSNPLVGSFSVLTLAGVGALYTMFLLFTEY